MLFTQAFADRTLALALLETVEAIVGSIASAVLELFASVAIGVKVPLLGEGRTGAGALGSRHTC